MTDKVQLIIESEVSGALDLQKTLEDTENELMQNETFKKFLELQKAVPAEIAKIWKNIEAQMIEADIKSIKGDWGWITIAERTNWTVNEDQLPNKFFKKVVDTKRITDTFRLEGKAPRGAESYTTKYLTKGIK